MIVWLLKKNPVFPGREEISFSVLPENDYPVPVDYDYKKMQVHNCHYQLQLLQELTLPIAGGY